MLLYDERPHHVSPIAGVSDLSILMLNITKNAHYIVETDGGQKGLEMLLEWERVAEDKFVEQGVSREVAHVLLQTGRQLGSTMQLCESLAKAGL